MFPVVVSHGLGGVREFRRKFGKCTKEKNHEFVESSELILKVIMTKFAGFVNGHSSV